jgi:TrpR-related protein YerC/YecD
MGVRMKSRQSEKKPGRGDYQKLFQALASLETPRECAEFLEDLCTPADRWRAVGLLKAGRTYRQINEQTGMSVTTIGRVARFMTMGSGGYERIFQRLKEKKK